MTQLWLHTFTHFTGHSITNSKRRGILQRRRKFEQEDGGGNQRYTYRVLQTIQMKLILLWVQAERAVLGRAKTALKFKYEI